MAGSMGRIVLTGSNGSLVSATVSRIVSTSEFAGYHGIYTVRDTTAAPALHCALRTSDASRPHSHDIELLDLNDLTNVREVAATINARIAAAKIPPIRTLILTAGWQEFTTQTWTKDGFDMTFMASYLRHWLLTMMFLQGMDREPGKIVVIGSLAHDSQARKNNSAGQLKDPKWKVIFHDSTEPVARGTWSTTKDDPSWCAGFRRYAAAKMCELLMISELQRRLDTDPSLNGVSVIGIDPGTMPTNLSRQGPWALRVLLFKIIMPLFAGLAVWLSPNGSLRTTQKSAGDILAASFDPSPQKRSYFNGSARAEMSAEARDTVKQRLLWRETLGYTQLKPGESALMYWM
ncbi:putative Ketoreductase (KR) domain-containing protein [Seiridium unicorne]|uniref:Ketoreductase (KR) domain-containing protein n=1 Tax=Seiridium unicorne TaxID=138068 RepID=A0ABR2UWD8_9PEZI